MVSGDNEPRLLDEVLISEVDALADSHSVANVKLVANTYKSDNGQFKTLWIDTMYVEQSLDDDPFYSYYRQNGQNEPEELPFR